MPRNPAAQTSSKAPVASLLRESHVVANLTHPMGRGRVQSDSKAGRRRLRACSTPAAAITDSANGGGPNANTASQTQRPRLDHPRRFFAFDPRSPKVSGGTKGPWRLHDPDGQQVSPPTAIRRHSARSTRTASETPIACPWDNRRDDVSRPTSAWTMSRRSTSFETARTTDGCVARGPVGKNGRWRGGLLSELFCTSSRRG